MSYTWTAIYRDGGFAQQRRNERLHLDTSVLASIQLKDHEGRPFLEQLFEPQQRAIYHVLPHTPLSDVPCHMLGWQETLQHTGRELCVQHIAYVSEDGRIVMAGRYDEALPWFATVRPVDDRFPDLSWVAYYEDGKTDPMVEPVTRHEIGFRHLDFSRLMSVVFYGNRGMPWFEQYFDRGQRVIFRRRCAMAAGGLLQGEISVVNLLGWQLTAQTQDGEDSNIQHIAYTMGDESIVMAGAFQPKHPWFYDIVRGPGDDREVGSLVPGHEREVGAPVPVT
jgi:hypothetical protein